MNRDFKIIYGENKQSDCVDILIKALAIVRAGDNATVGIIVRTDDYEFSDYCGEYDVLISDVSQLLYRINKDRSEHE